MKATGIVRRIDELGRIVIPKEIRRSFKIREGDQLEIFTDRTGEIILKKYSPMGELGTIVQQYIKSLTELTNATILVTDRDQVSAAVGSQKAEYEGKTISTQLEQLQNERKNVFPGSGTKRISLVEGEKPEDRENCTILQIICAGDVTGSVILIPKRGEEITPERELEIAKAVNHFMGSQMEM